MARLCYCLHATEILQLFAAVCLIPCGLAFVYTPEAFNDMIHAFSQVRRDTAILLPLELRLHFRNKSMSDYNKVIDLLMEVIQKRRKFVQKLFYNDFSAQGYIVSNSRRFLVEDGKFTLYYYVTFLGTSYMRTLKSEMQSICHRLATAKNSGLNRDNCTALAPLRPVVLYNLLLLATFKFLPADSGELNSLFFEFNGSKGKFVTAHHSDQEHDIHHLLCRLFLQCGPALCDLRKVDVPTEVKNLPEWSLFDAYLNTSAALEAILPSSDANETTSIAELMNLGVDTIFKQGPDDITVHRSWCMRLGFRSAPNWLLTWMASASVVFLLLCS